MRWYAEFYYVGKIPRMRWKNQRFQLIFLPDGEKNFEDMF